jgi:hypothetical protein
VPQPRQDLHLPQGTLTVGLKTHVTWNDYLLVHHERI